MSSTTIEVAKYIHDLLYEYSSVIVPDLGAFSTRNKMAAINEENNTISPPTKTVIFNERLKVNDGVLVGHIAKMESIPPSLVEDALKKFAADTKATLQVGEAVALGSLGTLQYQTNNGIEFYPTAGLNLSLNSFGFDTLDLPTITATTPPSSNENIGAAGIGGTSELDLPSMSDKDLPEEEEIPTTIDSKRTVSSVLAENAQNLPPTLPPEERRRSGGGWFWLLPLLILGLCFMLVMQLSKDEDKGNMANNNGTQTEESSGLWSIPPFSWFAGGGDTDKGLADNGNNNGSSNTDSNNSSNKTNSGDDNSNTNKGSNNTTGENGSSNTTDGTIETVDSGNKNTNGSDSGGNTGSSNSDNSTENTINDTKTGVEGKDVKTSPSTTDNTDTNTDKRTTSTTDNTDTNTTNSTSTNFTNASALNNVNITEAKAGDYAASNAPKGYYIIIGAFSSKANANKAIGKLKSKGYEAYALQTTSSKYYRVGIYGTADGKTAKERYNKAREKENAKAWMLKF
ncbi:MAG: SPOR domain-containing protein [Chitinophagales bacterium]